MLKFSTLALAIAGSLVMASTETVYAFNIQNSSFETGNFTNWEAIGQTTVEGSDFGVSPTMEITKQS
jgi:outer membrane protein assembly factor BamE (lipoprotein component of BamABCDE complex)